MLGFFLSCIRRDMRLSLSHYGDGLAQLGFFLMIASLFPIAVGPAPEKLSALASSILWIAALLAVAPAFDRLFSDDMTSGHIEQIAAAGQPLSIYVLAKSGVYLVVHGLPLWLLAPLIGGVMGLDSALYPVMALSLGLGLMGLTLLGAVMAALTLGARRASVLSAILVLPLALPILIFGIMAIEAEATHMPAGPHLMLLGGMVLFLLACAPVVAGFGLASNLESD